jgi:phthalate 4,5-cis-dihydrodiol dehydrogenase
MPEILKLGFAGLGMAAGLVLPEISKLPYVKVAAAADLRKHALEKFRRELGGEVYGSIEDMCKSPNIDAVYVATPHEFHAQHSIMALENRKHVIVEKPMALSIGDCERMNITAEKYGVKLMCGHTHSFDPPIQKMREIVKSGELGRVLMISTSYYKDFMYREWSDHDLEMSRGVVLNQGPHQVDIVRLLGGGMVRSIRAMAGIGDPERPPEGHYVCYLEFDNGIPASLVFSGYAFFQSAELVGWIGEGGQPRHPELGFKRRRALKALGTPEQRKKILEERLEQWRYGGKREDEWAAHQGDGGEANRHQPFFGMTIVTCEEGDIRQSPDGLYVYTEDGKREITVPRGSRGREAELGEFYEAIVYGRPVAHDGRWGEATLEVCLGILQSGAERREILMSRQVPARD